jgi:hypothetical protein
MLKHENLQYTSSLRLPLLVQSVSYNFMKLTIWTLMLDVVENVVQVIR